jgi:hypothetical protein
MLVDCKLEANNLLVPGESKMMQNKIETNVKEMRTYQFHMCY